MNLEYVRHTRPLSQTAAKCEPHNNSLTYSTHEAYLHLSRFYNVTTIMTTTGIHANAFYRTPYNCDHDQTSVPIAYADLVWIERTVVLFW